MYLSPNARARLARFGRTASKAAVGTIAHQAGKHLVNTFMRKRSAKPTLSKPLRYKNALTMKYGIAKRHLESGIYVPAGNRLNVKELSAIPRGTGINERERDEIQATGVRIRLELVAVGDFTAPISLNYALIQMKQRTVPFAASITDASVEKNFLRATGNSRGLDFDLEANGALKRVLPINSDKYDVITRGEVVITNPLDYLRGGRTAKVVDRYVKCNKKLKYDGADQYDCVNPICMVTWPTRWDNNVLPLYAGGVEEARAHVLSFRDKV